MNEPTGQCSDTDDEIMSRVIASSDAAAFTCLVRRHQARVIGFAARMFGGDLDTGADIA